MIRRASSVFLAAIFLGAGCARAPHRPLTPVPIHAAPGGFYHVVLRGETVYHIAKSYDVDMDELMRRNSLARPSDLKVGQNLFIPSGAVIPLGAPVFPAPAAGGITLEEAKRIIGSSSGVSWQTITVHHSGTEKGSAARFHRNHLRRHMGGLFYHFVIGNGSYTSDGQIEVGWRWKKQVNANRLHDIQICLVGNFSKQRVSEAQFESLVNLITALRETYHIPVSNVRGHDDIKGKHTECPGKYFPFERLVTTLRK